VALRKEKKISFSRLPNPEKEKMTGFRQLHSQI